ncbi:hypothetical protein BGW38_002336 [Lunasporangiospora selenospora]|uniref:UFSP1/2/DUB catalytic domain-containing protein n=1 Tax=Lunasporangiospora selenospora TaxID=979761 RepID=A0A9P6KCZ5_9FUNG|nr:hypothetical protein BGW38_002336 [Lunasporangiospora selenospora]
MSVEHGVTKVAYLADPSIVFYQSDRSDRGWGCGYRNIQMLLSYVICQPSSSGSEATSTHASSERRKVTPTIQDLQRQLEFAWSIGFDPTGAAQLGHKVVNTQKWIGTTEAWSVLSSLGVRCNMLDFHRPTGPGGTHPALLDAVRDYFRASEWSALAPPNPYGLGGIDRQQRGVIQTRRPPIYMQHQGHSRTIVGYELLENGEANLLVFDPGRWLHKSISKINRAALSRSVTDCKGTSTTTRDGLLDAQYFLKAFRLQLTPSNTKSQYQLLGISGLYNDSGDSARSSTRPNELDLFSENSALSVGWNHEEHQESKLVVSSRVP